VSGVLDSTKVYCMGALLNTDIQLEDEEIEFLNTIMDIEMWRDNYNLYSGSGILFNSEYHSNVIKTEEGNARFNEIFIKYAKQKPRTIIKHFIEVNSIWWSIPERGAMHSVVANNDYLSEGTNGAYDNHSLIKGGREFIEGCVATSMKTSFRYELFYRPAVAILVSVIAIVAVCIKEKKKSYLLILLPMILNIGTYVFLMSSQDHRYFYPCYMTEYISIVILAASFLKDKTRKEVKQSKKLDKEKAKTLVIIPAYNEAESIKKVVNSVYEQKIENCDVIVINDGSKDNTYEEAKKTKSIVIDSPNNLGIGGAVQTGYLYAKENDYDIAIQLDGDGQHNPKYLRKLIEEVENGNDLVIGSRFIEKTDYDQTFFRMLGINVISFTIKLMTGRKIYDTTSGFRASSRNAIDEFVKLYPYDYPEPCTNMRMIKKGYKVKEIPVEMRKRETGVSSISPIKAVSYMFKVTLSILLMGLKD
ncbi:MAG: glycosyltransferase family 2 protein, partial [Clostridia bacterium]